MLIILEMACIFFSPITISTIHISSLILSDWHYPSRISIPFLFFVFYIAYIANPYIFYFLKRMGRTLGITTVFDVIYVHSHLHTFYLRGMVFSYFIRENSPELNEVWVAVVVYIVMHCNHTNTMFRARILIPYHKFLPNTPYSPFPVDVRNMSRNGIKSKVSQTWYTWHTHTPSQTHGALNVVQKVIVNLTSNLINQWQK